MIDDEQVLAQLLTHVLEVAVSLGCLVVDNE